MDCWNDSCVSKPEWKWNNQTLGSSGARHDWDIYAHAFDQTNSSGTPYRYASATSFGSVCSGSDIATTSGNTLYSGTRITSQKSCTANTLNAGNWYSSPAATAGSDMHSKSSYPSDAKNSICPKGWQLPDNAGIKSYNTLITTYGISVPASSDSALLTNSAMSFVRLGGYLYDYGSLGARGDGSYYWSSTTYNDTNSHFLLFESGRLVPQNSDNRAYGFSIRCVSR